MPEHEPELGLSDEVFPQGAAPADDDVEDAPDGDRLEATADGAADEAAEA